MHIEDVFVRFFKQIVSTHYNLFPHKDYDVSYSFYNSIREGKHLTEAQRTYVVAMLQRYKGLSHKLGLDYKAHLTSPTWRNPVRVINKDKTVWVEDENDILTICLRFPFQLKEPFTEQIEKIYQGKSYWDYENKVRKLNAYKINIFALHDWLEKHGLTIIMTYVSM